MPLKDGSSSSSESDADRPEAAPRQCTAAAADFQSRLMQAVRDSRVDTVRALLPDAESLGIDISTVRDCSEKGNTLLHLVLAKKCAKGR